MVFSVLQQTLQIVGIVFVLMVGVEFAEVRFGEQLRRWLGRSTVRQCVSASALGVVPGCITAFLVTSLYKAGIVGFGALAAVMLATAGDEAFVMLALIPRTAALIFALCFAVGIVGGIIADVIVRRFGIKLCASCGAEIHAEDTSGLSWRHFMAEHIYGHIIRKHLPQLLLWLFGTLLVLRLAAEQFDLEALLPGSSLFLVALAALVGLLPESGPHLVFLLLFAEGLVPFSVLATSSIAQDGHGVLPLLAYAPRDVAYVKVFTSAIGFAVGLILLALGL